MAVHGPDQWYSARQAAKLAGLTIAMVNYLCREQLVEPTCNCKRGYRTPRHYSFGDIVALRLVSRLSKAGVSVLRLKKALKRLRQLHPQITLTSLPGKYVVTDGRDIYVSDKGGTLERAMDGQLAFAFVVELSQIQKDVAKELRAGDWARVA